MRGLKELFDEWKEEQKKEVENIIKKKDITRKEFEETVYKKKENTISSHFSQFFDKACNDKPCPKSNRQEGKAWEIALKEAFNMDGTYENFDVKKGGYRFICLLKEANDSQKTCINDYIEQSGVVNEWIVNDGKDVCGKKYKAEMLNKMNCAMASVCNKEDPCEYDFKIEMAFMNVNKRGGTSTTAGRDETAVINYAKKYRKYILEEMEILAQEQEKVCVFICGSKKYFMRLMKALIEDTVDFVEGDTIVQYKRFTFVQVPHPSNWRVNENDLAQEMKKGIKSCFH